MTSVYRYFAADGTLLYVGLADKWERRACDHSLSKSWFQSVVRVELQHFATRAEARAAEKAAIIDDNPRENVADNQRSLKVPRIFRLDCELVARLDAASKALNRTRTSILEEALECYLESISPATVPAS